MYLWLYCVKVVVMNSMYYIEKIKEEIYDIVLDGY